MGVANMSRWVFEPGHTAAAFSVRHMMVPYARGHFKNVHGSLVYDPLDPRVSSVDVSIDAKEIWTGEPQRDAHLRSEDFLDVERYPQILYRGAEVALVGPSEYIVTGALTIRGITRKTDLRAKY